LLLRLDRMETFPVQDRRVRPSFKSNALQPFREVLQNGGMEPVSAAVVAKLRRERDLYQRLLNLGRQAAVEPLLEEAVTLIVEVADARQGYLEVYLDDDRPGRPRFSISHGFSGEQVQGVRRAISRGIIAETLATGEAVMTGSALLDPRFRDRQSVLDGQIQAVLCVPIGKDQPRGVLYLQGHGAPGPFSDEDRERAELFADHLEPLVDRVLAEQRREQASDPTKAPRETLRLSDVVGRSAALASALRQVALVAPLDVHVLLTGETGTGKSQLARVIHENSPRAGQPFVEVNCAALPDTLIESELFGALPGAHSTATRRIEGKVAAAERGTLLLDEISELSLSAQAKLLQILQSQQYYPLGASKLIQADVRVIAASNIDLRCAVADHRFRDDLFYRLQVVPVHVPSLAERREDIAELAAFFCGAVCRRHQLPHLTLSRNAVRALEAAAWPGNVRQLAHAVEAGVIRAAGEGAAQVEAAHLFPDQHAGAGSAAEPATFQEATRRFQAELLRKSLEATSWNVMETARRLDLARSHVYNLIRAFGIERGRT
jgi:transcriptional regulator with GAF, ATPase, and Fis domain